MQALIDDGTAALQQAVGLDPRCHEAWDLQASYHTLLGDPKAATKAWQQALRIVPNERQYLHDLGITLEALKDHKGAHEAYQQLATLEQHRLDDAAIFSQEAFSQAVQEIWQELQAGLLQELQLPLHIELWVEPFPAQTLIEQASLSAPFDPWLPLYLDVQTNTTDAPTVYLILYHRNIERIGLADSDDRDSLQLYLHDLLEDTLFVLDGIFNDDAIQAT